MEKEYKLLIETFRRVSRIHQDDQNRLYRFVTAYLAVAISAISFLLSQGKYFTTIDPIFWAIASVTTTFYIIFYSYVSVHLMRSAYYLFYIWERLNTFHKGEMIPAWESYKPDMQFWQGRDILNCVLSAWRIITLILAIGFPFIGFRCKNTTGFSNTINWIAFFLSLVIGSFAIVYSAFYARKVYEVIRPKRTKTTKTSGLS